MKWKKPVSGVPLHPLLVHFPIAFWLAVPPLDVGALLTGRETWWTLALSATVIGLAIGAAAVVTGLLEYMQPSLAGIDMRLAARHGVRTSLAWCVFMVKAVAAIFLPSTEWSMIVCLLIDLIGCALLVQGVYFGTRQVYEQLEKN
jgi:uncharacterized membrane protein